jgi:hypothetical protein
MRTTLYLTLLLLLASGCASSGEQQPAPAVGETSAEIYFPDGLVVVLSALARSVAPQGAPSDAGWPWWVWCAVSVAVGVLCAAGGVWWAVRHHEQAKRLPVIGSAT